MMFRIACIDFGAYLLLTGLTYVLGFPDSLGMSVTAGGVILATWYIIHEENREARLFISPPTTQRRTAGESTEFKAPDSP